MIIRREQQSILAQNAAKRFEEEMVTRLQNLFPQTSGKLREPGLREVIECGAIRARSYGIVRERDVGRYIAIMMMFGPHFDSAATSGPLYKVLHNPRLAGSRLRTDALCQAALLGLRTRTRRTGRKPQW